MGKRELLLVGVFVLLGAGLYQLTAPPAPPGERGFSLSGIFNELRRDMRAHNASARLTTTGTYDVEPDVTELRVGLRNMAVSVTGSAGSAIESEVAVQSTGADEAEARQLASETVAVFERTGSIVFVRVHFPEGGRQTASLTLNVPARLRVRLETSNGGLEVRHVAGLEVGQSRGAMVVEDIDGPVIVQHRGGQLRVARAQDVRVTARGSDVRLEDIRGEAVLNTQAGELTAAAMLGGIELEATGSRIRLDGLEKATGNIRVRATAGEVTLEGVARETQIDVRGTDLRVAMVRPAPLAIISEAGQTRIALPPGGYRLEAETRGGRITSEPPSLLDAFRVLSGDTPSSGRATGEVHGGGPLISIRSRGDITFVEK